MTQSRGLARQFQIFPPGPRDAEALGRVHVASWRETYADLLPAAYLARMSEADYARRFHKALLHPHLLDVTLAAADAWGLVGYVAGGLSRRGDSGEAEITVLYVLREAQDHGLGRALISGAARALRAGGASSLVISVLRDNTRARGFYEHLGGVADPPRQEHGPGGGLLYEVAYRWPDIGVLTR